MKIVDSNEPEAIRSALKDLGWEQSRLHSADFAFMSQDGQSIGIERKTVSDLVSSMVQRLPLQFFHQIEDYQIPILLVEGHWGLRQNHITSMGQIYNLTWEQVWNFIRTWQDRGMTLEITIDLPHTIDRLEQIYKYYQKDGHTGGIDRNTTGDSRIIALQCPGVGEQIAKKLLAAFGSLQKIANADYIDISRVEGVGMKKAMEVYNHFRKE